MSTSSSGSGSSSSGAKRPAESDLAELPSAKRLAVDLAAAAGGGSSPSIHSPASSNAAPLGEHAHPLSSAAASASQDAADEEQTGGFQAGIVKTQLAHLRRQFAVVKSEAETTRARVTQLTSQRNQDALVADEVMRQWTQVQDEMTSTLMSIDPVSGLQEHAQFVAQPYSTGLAAHVAELNSQTTPTLADTAWFLRVRDTTQARAQQLRSVIAKLAVSIDQQRAVIHGLTQQRNELMSNSAALSPVAATVAQENAQQQTKLHDLQNALAALQQELFQRSNDLASQAATVDLKASLAASQHEIELLNDELRSAQRKSLKLEEEVREYREARSTNAATSSLAASTSALLAAATAATDPSTGPSTPLTAPPTLLPATSTEGGSASSSNPAEVEALQRQVAALLKTMQDHHAAFDTHRDEKSRLLKEVQALKQQLSFLPDAVIAGHPMYKQLKVQCDTAVKELMDARVLMDMLQREHFKLMQARRVELEQIELAEVARRNGYVEELRRLEDHYAKVKNEYDKLLYRQEKKTLSETTIQSSTANQEMRELIQSLQSQNTLLKSEVARNRSKADDLRVALAKLNPNDPLVQQAMAAAAEQDSASGGASTSSGSNSGANSEAVATIKQLREDLKKAQENEKEAVMLLNVYKSSSREPRDKVDVLAAERRTAAENTELRARLSELEKLTQGGDVGTAFRVSRQQVEELSRQLDSKKQDEDALIAEMDSIGQSFQDMQEQNSRLLQQLNEKDDANFQLMSERLKASQLQQMLRDEKDIIEGKMAAMQAQVEAQNELLKKFEERERAIHEQLDVAEKDGLLKIQLIEGFKRKAVDLSAEVQQNNAVLERLKEAHDKLEEALRVKTEQAETLANKELKLVDENNYLQAKIGKSKKLELKDKTKISDKSESQLAELNLQYRQLIFCPICRTNVKDTVMLRCFHSFCNECVQKRYDTRQRACPTCAKQFGANDFQRFYL